MVPHKVYHSSPTRGLKLLLPQAGTHGLPWVYATKDPVMAAVFISPTGGDFTCQVGRDPETGRPYICERFAGAFEHRYAGRSGSIYVLPGATFIEGLTPWDEEVVSEQAVRPLEELPVDDAEVFLLRLAAEDRLIIKRYPERIDDIPADDEDLVEKAAEWTLRHGRRTLDTLERYHPHLVGRVLDRLTRDDGRRRGADDGRKRASISVTRCPRPRRSF